MKLIVLMVLSFFSYNAFSYVDGTFSCQNMEGVPNNTYTISTDASGIPLVEASLYYKVKNKPEIAKYVLKGYATISTSSDGTDTLILQGITLGFNGNKLLNCK